MNDVPPLSEDTLHLLRHLVATIAYRSSGVLADAPAELGDAQLSDDGWSGAELVNHMTNVLSYARARLAHDERERFEYADWQTEQDRFYGLLGDIDAALAAGVSMEFSGEEYKLVQGPLADVLTHIGQLAALRRKIGRPVPPKNYIQAPVIVGRTGVDQE